MKVNGCACVCVCVGISCSNISHKSTYAHIFTRLSANLMNSPVNCSGALIATIYARLCAHIFYTHTFIRIFVFAKACQSTSLTHNHVDKLKGMIYIFLSHTYRWVYTYTCVCGLQRAARIYNGFFTFLLHFI